MQGLDILVRGREWDRSSQCPQIYSLNVCWACSFELSTTRKTEVRLFISYASSLLEVLVRIHRWLRYKVVCCTGGKGRQEGLGLLKEPGINRQSERLRGKQCGGCHDDVCQLYSFATDRLYDSHMQIWVFRSVRNFTELFRSTSLLLM